MRFFSPFSFLWSVDYLLVCSLAERTSADSISIEKESTWTFFLCRQDRNWPSGDFDLLDSFLFRRDNSQMATGVLKLCRVANSLDSSDFRSTTAAAHGGKRPKRSWENNLRKLEIFSFLVGPYIFSSCCCCWLLLLLPVGATSISARPSFPWSSSSAQHTHTHTQRGGLCCWPVPYPV